MQVINTRPFRRTGLHPSHRRFTDERVFIPRHIDNEEPAENEGFDVMNCGLRRRDEKSRDDERARRDSCGWRRYWRIVAGSRGRRSGNIVLSRTLDEKGSEGQEWRALEFESGV